MGQTRHTYRIGMVKHPRNQHLILPRRCEVRKPRDFGLDRNGTGFYPVMGFGITSIEPTDLITRVFITCGIEQNRKRVRKTDWQTEDKKHPHRILCQTYPPSQLCIKKQIISYSVCNTVLCYRIDMVSVLFHPFYSNLFY